MRHPLNKALPLAIAATAFPLFPFSLCLAEEATPACASASLAMDSRSPAAQPYPYVSAGSFSGPAVPASTDPLVRYRWPKPQASDGLEIYLLKPERVVADPPASFAGLESLLTAKPAVTVSGPGTIRVDFGRENAGWFEIDSPDCPGGLRLSISEYNQPEYTNIGDKTVVPERIGDTWRAKFNNELYEGVRFAFIHVDRVDKPWHITGIRLVCQIKPANYEGSFTSSNPLLDRIWHMGAYSVKLGNLKEFTTPILIERSDRRLWNGMDFYLYNSANLIAFDNRDFVRQQIAKVHAPPEVNCGIFSYELYDILSICDFYRSTGDAALVRDCMPLAVPKLERAQERWTNYTDTVADFFMGWDERLGGFERVTAFNRWNYRMLCIRAWRTWAGVMDRLGETAARDRYNGLAEARIHELRQDPRWHYQLDVHGCAEAIQAGFCTPEEIRAMVEGEFSDRVNRVSYSQANTGLIVQGMARAGLYDDAIVTLEDQWGATLRYGGTTTFEMFHPSAADVLGTNDPPINGQCGMTSLCHPWGAVVCQYLNEVVAGIQPTTPGFATVDILPHLGRRLTAVSAITPTPHGPVSASCDVTAGTSRVVLPAGVTGRIGIPKVERRITRITINGTLAWDGSFHAVAGIAGASEDTGFVIFSGVPSGTYDCRITYQGATPAPRDTPIVYPVRCLGEDRRTQGNWGGVHGRDGYVLPDYDGAGKDVRKLPSYVDSVTLERCAHRVWAAGVEDVRAPARDSGNSGPRTAAAMYTKDPEPTYQTMYADIAARKDRDYTLALYFVDWDSRGRSVGVQIIDPVSLKQQAAVQVVRNYRDGVYLMYRCTGPVRVRVDTITKPDATLSGIFFSP